MSSRSLFFLFVAGPVTVFAPLAAAETRLAPYRAVEDLTLDLGKASGDLASVSARLVTEFTGSACAGYKTTTRIVIEATNSDGGGKVNDQRSLTIETPGGRLDFDNQSFTDGKADRSSKGTAQRSADGVTVDLAEPARKTVRFEPSLVFPSEQVVRIIEAARAGTRFLDFTGYDGMDDGESPAPMSVVIGAASTAADDAGDGKPVTSLAGVRHWPVTISFFDKNAAADQPPDYALRGALYENGVMRESLLDYGTFALASRLVELDMLPQTPCP